VPLNSRNGTARVTVTLPTVPGVSDVRSATGAAFRRQTQMLGTTGPVRSLGKPDLGCRPFPL